MERDKIKSVVVKVLKVMRDEGITPSASGMYQCRIMEHEESESVVHKGNYCVACLFVYDEPFNYADVGHLVPTRYDGDCDLCTRYVEEGTVARWVTKELGVQAEMGWDE
tara:strand:+ start:161 stop:487 length:327 start_codon:yes stop_codon:yes gene_type:complete